MRKPICKLAYWQISILDFKLLLILENADSWTGLIAVLTAPPESAAQPAVLLQQAGIKGILNFTSVHLDVTPEIYLKNYDIITSLEEIGFFI
jgi:NADH/NAD ratio-sensing transcriptional regulator Rex